MNSQVEHVSLRFYDYICKVIGTEEVVQARRRIITALDYIHDHQIINAGSKAEGLDLKGSDFDAMNSFQIFSVCEDLSTLEYYSLSKLIFVMDTTDTKAGFTRLKFVPEGCFYGPFCNDLSEVEDGKIYVSSKKFREYTVSSLLEQRIHGPCVTWGDGSYESANCLSCNHWITGASEWISRYRTFWPLTRTINAVVKSGTLFVPIGKKGSKYEDLEFRVSYSIAEKILIKSFNHVQLLSYALMKIVLKDILRKTHGESICSYFIKTIMFWLCEETSPSVWSPDRLLRCFIDCFKRLLYCVQHNTCVHYFIPENDLFEDRFHPNEQREILLTLQSLLRLDWQLLLLTDTLGSFAKTLSPSTFCFTPYSSALPFLSFLERTGLPSFILRNRFESCLKINNKETRKLALLTLNSLMIKNVSLYLRKEDSNKSFYRLYNTCLCHLLMGTQNDAISGWLVIASLFYRCNRFRHCIQILNFCSRQLTPETIVLEPPVSEGSQHLFNENITDAKRLTRQHSFSMARKLYTIETVRFQQNSFLFPPELLHAAGIDVNKNSGFLSVVPSLKFSQFLYQLCQNRSVLGRNVNMNSRFSISYDSFRNSAGTAFIM